MSQREVQDIMQAFPQLQELEMLLHEIERQFSGEEYALEHLAEKFSSFQKERMQDLRRRKLRSGK